MASAEISHGRGLTRLGALFALIAMAPGTWAAIVFGPGADWVSGVTPENHSVGLAASLELMDPSGINELIALTGSGSVANGAVQVIPTGSGNEFFATEIVAMSLTGVSAIYGPVTVTRTAQSDGFVYEPVSDATLAEGYFDVFLEFEFNLHGISMHNTDASRIVASDVATWPAVGTEFGSTGAIVWRDENGQLNGLLTPRFTLTMTSVVPVPSALLLFSSCVAGLGIRGRFRSTTRFRVT